VTPPAGSNFIGQDGLSAAITPGATATVNAQLATYGSVSGKVTAASGGAPIAGVMVTVEGGPGFGTATTAANGTYTVDRLAAGTYDIVCFAPPTGSNYLDQCRPNPVTVTLGATTTGINAALGAAGSIAGTAGRATVTWPRIPGRGRGDGPMSPGPNGGRWADSSADHRR
jgi:hypothetical protein